MSGAFYALSSQQSQGWPQPQTTSHKQTHLKIQTTTASYKDHALIVPTHAIAYAYDRSTTQKIKDKLFAYPNSPTPDSLKALYLIRESIERMSCQPVDDTPS